MTLWNFLFQKPLDISTPTTIVIPDPFYEEVRVSFQSDLLQLYDMYATITFNKKMYAADSIDKKYIQQ